MARKTKTAEAFDTLRRQRATEDGRACIDIAERLYTGKDATLEHFAEARGWVRLGLEHDKAKDSKLLQELRDKLEQKQGRAARLAKMRGAKPALEVVKGGAP